MPGARLPLERATNAGSRELRPEDLHPTGRCARTGSPRNDAPAAARPRSIRAFDPLAWLEHRPLPNDPQRLRTLSALVKTDIAQRVSLSSTRCAVPTFRILGREWRNACPRPATTPCNPASSLMVSVHVFDCLSVATPRRRSLREPEADRAPRTRRLTLSCRAAALPWCLGLSHAVGPDHPARVGKVRRIDGPAPAGESCRSRCTAANERPRPHLAAPLRARLVTVQ